MENPMYGAIDDGKLAMNKLNSAPKRTENEYVIDTHVMNIYTNPTEQMLQSGAITALQRMQESHDVIPSIHGEESCDVNNSQSEADNAKNEEIEDNQYLEPVKQDRPPELEPLNCDPHGVPKHDPNRALPDPHSQTKRRPQRFIRPKSPKPLNPPKDNVEAVAHVTDDVIHHEYEDDELTEENVYAEIPEDVIYEDIDEVMKTVGRQPGQTNR